MKAEIADQLRQGNEAKVKAAASWATLSRRFPGIDRKVVALPVPSSELGQYETWRERILAESDVLRRVEASLLRSEGQSARAKADKIPDPTLGVFTASEQGARERIYGVTFSMPIPSGTRSARYSQAMAQESAARQDVDLIKRELEAAIARDVEMASGAYENFRIATEGLKPWLRTRHKCNAPTNWVRPTSTVPAAFSTSGSDIGIECTAGACGHFADPLVTADRCTLDLGVGRKLNALVQHEAPGRSAGPSVKIVMNLSCSS